MVIKKESGGPATYVKSGGASVEYTHKIEDALVYKPRGAKIQATKLTNATGVQHKAVK